MNAVKNAVNDLINDPVNKVAGYVILAGLGIVAAFFAAVVVIPVAIVGALGYAAFRFYQWKTLPTYEVTPQEESTLTDTHLREHMAILAASGWGKTSLLETLIFALMKRTDPIALFILDSQDDMLNRLERLDVLLERDPEQICIIDPEDQPPLNFFDFSGTGAETDELFHYLFTAIDRDLTAAQATTVTYLLRLIRHIENPTIKTLKDIMEKQEPHPAIEHLDEIARDFFTNQFYAKGTMQQTRKAVASRCYSILENRLLASMFSAQTNSFNAQQLIQDRAWCFINTSLKHLGEKDSALFGRYFIAQILSGAIHLGPTNKLRAVLILDEAFEYFDQKTERILSQARKYGLGLVFATQHLGQMTDSTRRAVLGNTAVKVAGRLSHTDANTLAKEMRCETADILSLQKTKTYSTFVWSPNDADPHPVMVPFGFLNQQPQMTADQHRALRKLNKRQLVSATIERSPEPSTHTASTLPNDIQGPAPETPPKGQPERW